MRAPLILLPLPVLLSGCGGSQSALDAQGYSGALLRDLIVLIVVVCLVVWIGVMIMLAWSLTRRRDGQAGDSRGSEQRLGVWVSGAVAATVLIIGGLTILSFQTTRSLDRAGDPDLTIRVRAQQWWWQFVYEDADAGSFQTANEIHIPVGKEVRVRLESTDVIHSFWVPSLGGKQDLVPGRENLLTLRAERPGVYRGQCAEFCGLQHSHMAFFVIAEEEESYRQWAATQRQPGAQTGEAEASAGKAVFMARRCAACHTIRGTGATGTTGPDLTHVGSRRTIAAGLMDNTRGSLAAWIADPQTLKPGNNMPLVPLTGDELRQLSAYMESLK
ncbi:MULTISPECIES: cytochrome c oxidase subunit II [unclassified Neorhizobium]|uniref:cytochrome c oxidase subunit II n=1 Tax=unclassified Neorhizobium TaxID=2629175 RepID=UPI001FF3A461|nr:MULTISPECIES: cytochrome c oxidase subunit II [unclassified Neorhizobium]MCJ9669656.1 cytochrome c oxidase subunit II [Neorhizobium sp. SHOUNA12B]MCJ9745724.1 cytochrome c oxidase subunit II [Neorhizobium sp. SHOUNA12A]